MIAQWLAAHDQTTQPRGSKVRRSPIPIRGPKPVNTRQVVKAPKKRYGIHPGLKGHTKPHRYDYS